MFKLDLEEEKVRNIKLWDVVLKCVDTQRPIMSVICLQDPFSYGTFCFSLPAAFGGILP